VDDEVIICQACQRVLSRQGFEIETSTDARQGLAQATENDYAAVLLDIKMPELDGIQFLEALREVKPDLPVMIMTGYPSIPNAASAVRLGASDYVTKPFTPEQITQSVLRMLSRGANGAAEISISPGEEYTFLDESWVQLEIDGSARVGTVIRRPDARILELQLPRDGETLYQGLPLAGITFDDGARVIVPCPLSGVVVSANQLTADKPGPLFDDPFGTGWIACICSTQLEDELDTLQTRNIVLVNTDSVTNEPQREQLAELGCRVSLIDSEAGFETHLKTSPAGVFLFDVDSLGGRGPELVGKVRAASEGPKVIALASHDYRWEAAYRDQGIFYYAVAPFTDNEIVDILNAAFRRPSGPAHSPAYPKRPERSLHAIEVTNRNGHKVQLLAGRGLLSRYEGLGAAIMDRIIEQYIPVETSLSDTEITATVVLEAARVADRVMVLQAKDMGRLPGSLVRDTKAEYISAARENAGRVTTLVVQPNQPEHAFHGFDDRTVESLVGHIVSEMMSY
jgi:DNA-binding response OmpR family regulator